MSQILEILFHDPRLDFQVLRFDVQFRELHHEIMTEAVEELDVLLGFVQVFESKVDTLIGGIYFGIDLIMLFPEGFQILVRPVKNFNGVSQLLMNREDQEFDKGGNGLHDF